jgi:Family of unknown function (DUF6184)
VRLYEQALVAVGICFFAACGKHERDANSPAVDPEQVAPAPAAQSRSAAEAIAESRCKRESRCENVGDGKKFSSNTDCQDRIRADWKEDLNSRECPKGVHQDQLDECLTAIAQESCDSPFDSLERISECMANQICAD